MPKKEKGEIKKTRGFTLVEILIDVAIITLIATAVIAGFMASFKAISFAKARITAVAIANEKMEIIRNMPYDDLATESGTIYPPGDILDKEETIKKNIHFKVQTIINYVDDPFDGDALGTIPEKPQDFYPYDYKKVEIRVYKIGHPAILAKLTTDVSGSAAETASDTGILYLCIIDANGDPVADADVLIENTEVNPPVHIETFTDSSGCVMIPALPPDEQNHYHLVITKDGYSTDLTYPRTTQNPNQLQPDVDIMVQQVTQVTLAIDKVSTMIVYARDYDGNPMPNLNINIRGSKEVQFNPTTYKYDQNHDLDANGDLTLNDMEWDDYYFAVNTEDFYLSSIYPLQPVYLVPDSTLEITLYVTASNTAPRISTIYPESGVQSDVTTITIEGENFDGNPIVKLINPDSGAEIVGTDVDSQAHSIIDVDFDLGLGSAGFWDIWVENPNGEYAIQKISFEIIDE